MTTNTFYSRMFWHPFRVPMKHSLVTGGLRFAPTSGYFRSTLRVVNSFVTHRLAGGSIRQAAG